VASQPQLPPAIGLIYRNDALLFGAHIVIKFLLAIGGIP
jgi:hypothetical protein